MTINSCAAFIVNLLQDVAVLRPLVYLAADEFNIQPIIFVTKAFQKRDVNGIWSKALFEISSETQATIIAISSDFHYWSLLTSYTRGFVITASESTLNNHKDTSHLIRITPKRITTITLQHGYECVGFLMNKNQIASHGSSIGFSSDIVCSWLPKIYLKDLRPFAGSRIVVTGPSIGITHTSKRSLYHNTKKRFFPKGCGVICENLHSPRVKSTHNNSDEPHDFIKYIYQLSDRLSRHSRSLVLRPHPGGQYFLKKGFSIPSNVFVDTRPSYQVDWSEFAFGISPPSSVLVDLYLSGTPTAVWIDKNNLIDSSFYRFLPEFSDFDQIYKFVMLPSAFPASSPPAPLKSLVRYHQCAYNNFISLFSDLLQEYVASPVLSESPLNPIQIGSAERILIMGPGLIPTIQLSFLAPSFGSHQSPATYFIDCLSLYSKLGWNDLNDEQRVEAFDNEFASVISRFNPTVLILSRYPWSEGLQAIAYAKRMNIPTIYHIDDDLLSPDPIILGDKYKSHSNPKRLAAIRSMLESVDIIYASNERLASLILSKHKISTSIYAGKIYCSAPAISSILDIHSAGDDELRFGYMGFGHSADLDLIAPAIERVLQRNPKLIFEVFGTIPVPDSLATYSDQITLHQPLRDYNKFIDYLNSRRWRVGIAPLCANDFNAVKSNTKWVEYSSCGIAVVASQSPVYNDLGLRKCVFLASTIDQWVSCIECAIYDSVCHRQLVLNSRLLLLRQYQCQHLFAQHYQCIMQARSRSRDSSKTKS